jgi:hypothetical protein
MPFLRIRHTHETFIEIGEERRPQTFILGPWWRRIRIAVLAAWTVLTAGDGIP